METTDLFNQVNKHEQQSQSYQYQSLQLLGSINASLVEIKNMLRALLDKQGVPTLVSRESGN